MDLKYKFNLAKLCICYVFMQLRNVVMCTYRLSLKYKRLFLVPTQYVTFRNIVEI